MKNILLSIVCVFGLLGCGGGSESNPATQLPTIQNQAPVVNAGQDSTYDEQIQISLTGTASDSDGNISSYSWIQTSGSSVTLINAGMAVANFTSPTVLTSSGAQVLVFELTVTDNDGAASTDSVRFTIIPVTPISELAFTDNKLALCVNTTATDNNWLNVRDFTAMNCDSLDISLLSGIENLTALSDLSLVGNKLVDIGTLAKLNTLTMLHLESNQIVDVSPVADLIGLTVLHFEQNEIVDISPVANLTALTEISLGSNQIIDISPLAGLTALATLSLGDNQIVDISVLEALTALSGLGIYSNQIVDISALVNLAALTELFLKNNKIIDISALANLTSLTTLNIESNQIVNISPLENLTALTALALSNNKIIDLSSLANLISLNIIHLNNNQISSINSLLNLISLTYIDLSGNDAIACDDLDLLEITLSAAELLRTACVP